MGAIRRIKTKRMTRALDQIYSDLRSPRHLSLHKSSKPAEDLPGLGQWYCIECAKYFEGENNFEQHKRGKNHKRRVRMLREEPYTQKDAEAAVGLWTDNGKKKKGEEAMEVERQIGEVDGKTG